jgi:hypothetical protein
LQQQWDMSLYPMQGKHARIKAEAQEASTMSNMPNLLTRHSVHVDRASLRTGYSDNRSIRKNKYGDSVINNRTNVNSASPEQERNHNAVASFLKQS